MMIRNKRADLSVEFERTIYRFFLPDTTIDLKIGELNRVFSRWLETKNHKNWFFLTAFNPGAKVRMHSANLKAHKSLMDHAKSCLWNVYPATAVSPLNRWPDEEGILVLDQTQRAVSDIAIKMRQVAIVAGRHDRKSYLIWFG